jgi:general secretion pathway protein I
MKAAHGFTLLEVLVALAIMALAFTALLRTSGLTAENSQALRLRMQAGWVAENRLAWLQSQVVSPLPGEENGVLVEGEKRWHWQQIVSETEDPLLLRVDLRILAAGAPHYQLAHLSTLFARPKRR